MCLGTGSESLKLASHERNYFIFGQFTSFMTHGVLGFWGFGVLGLGFRVLGFRV